MAKHTVTRKYSAVYRSSAISFDEGAVVDVDDDTAEWVNKDSPGCLVPVEGDASGDDSDDSSDDSGDTGDSGDSGDDSGDTGGTSADAGDDTGTEPDETVPERPKPSAPKADWHAYVLARGADPEAIADLKRDELAALYQD